MVKIIPTKNSCEKESISDVSKLDGSFTNIINTTKIVIIIKRYFREKFLGKKFCAKNSYMYKKNRFLCDYFVNINELCILLPILVYISL